MCLTKIGPLPGSGSHPYVPCRHQTNMRKRLSVTVAVHQQVASHIEYPDCDDIWELGWDVISSEVKINPTPLSIVLPLKCLKAQSTSFPWPYSDTLFKLQILKPWCADLQPWDPSEPYFIHILPNELMNTHQLPADVWGVHALLPPQQRRQTGCPRSRSR